MPRYHDSIWAVIVGPSIARKVSAVHAPVSPFPWLTKMPAMIESTTIMRTQCGHRLPCAFCGLGCHFCPANDTCCEDNGGCLAVCGSTPEGNCLPRNEG